MKRTIAALLFFIAFVPSLLAQQDSAGTPKKAEGGQTIPSLVLSDITGKKVNVADYSKSGKITVFSFWATWCAPCKKELTSLADLYEEWQKKYNVQIIAVSIDDSRNTGKVKPYVDGQRWPFEVLLDINQDLKRAFNIPSVPFTIVADKNGKIVYTHSGYLSGDEYILEEEIKKLSK